MKRVSGFSQITSLPQLRGHDRRDDVPVVGSAVGDGIDVLAEDQLAEVGVGIAGLVGAAVDRGVVFVDARLPSARWLASTSQTATTLDVGAAENLLQVPVDAVVAAADQSDENPLAGGRGTVEAEGRGGDDPGARQAAATAPKP